MISKKKIGCKFGAMSLTSRSNKRSGGKGSHGNTTFLIPPQICKRASDQGHGSGKCDTVDGSADNQGSNIFRNSAGDNEDDCNQECRGTVDVLACISAAAAFA